MDNIERLARARNAKILREIDPAPGAERVREADPFIGLRFHFNERDIASAQNAKARALQLLKKEGAETEQFEWLDGELLRIAQQYWTDHETDHRILLSELKKETLDLQRSLEKVENRLCNLTPTAWQVLEQSASQLSRKRTTREFLAEIQSLTTLVHAACVSISAEKSPTRVRRSQRFEECGEALWAVRERITNRPISHVFDVDAEREFTTRDAIFIHALMRAIDGKVSVSNVQDGLRRAGKARKQRK